MPEQKDPKAPVFNPKIKETIAAFKAENSPKNLNDILNEIAALEMQKRNLQRQGADMPDDVGHP